MKKNVMVLWWYGMITCLVFTNGAYPKSGLFKVGRRAVEWGAWRTSSCFKGLDYRTRRAVDPIYNGKYEWDVQFKNNYSSRINFSFRVADPYDTMPPTDRTDIKSGVITSGNDLGVIKSAESCDILISKVRFGDDDSGPYASCDN